MVYILQLCFLIVLIMGFKGSNNCYIILVGFQLISFVSAPLVANVVTFDTLRTLFNIVFCLINLLLIILPWRKARFESVEIEDNRFFVFYKRILYLVLSITIINNLIVLFILRHNISDPAVFKAQQGYRVLYESIPFFNIMFRYSSVSRNIGLLALPIAVYYIYNKRFKQAAKALIMSSATFIAAIASYSRAQILSFVVLAVCLYFYTEHVFDRKIYNTVRRIMYILVLVVAVGFVSITINRFNSPVMSYYRDNIPEESYIKSPSLYNIFEYASQGFPNGVMQMEVHDSEDVMYGEPLFYEQLMALSYFHLTSWTTEDYDLRFDKAYDKKEVNEGNTSYAFHGYTCTMIKIMGYLFTLIFDVIYYLYVYRKSIWKKISIRTLSIMVFLLWASINSIFYAEYSIAVYPLLFYLAIYAFYHAIYCRIKIGNSFHVKTISGNT